MRYQDLHLVINDKLLTIHCFSKSLNFDGAVRGLFLEKSRTGLFSLFQICEVKVEHSVVFSCFLLRDKLSFG